ncbi:ribosome modulation factor [Luteimonas sp. RIT-PG2_3]
MTTDKAREQGREAAKAGKPLKDNIYAGKPALRPLAQAWEQGYREAKR